MKVINRNDTVHTSHSRDAALRRLRGLNRWMVAGTAILTGVLTDVAANAFPGHAKSATGKAARGAKTQSNQHPLQPPAQAPQTTGTQETAPPVATPGETATPEATRPSEEAGAPKGEAAPEAQQAETHEAPAQESPQASSEPPVVSGGS